MSRRATPLSRGFPPVVGAQPRVLILGSLPGQKSLEMGEYYAQPQNAFWKIMGRLFGAEPGLAYVERLACLREHRVALWDVLAAGVRKGSLDSAIVASSVVVNDFESFFARNASLDLVCFNGRKAEELFRRHVAPSLGARSSALATRLLPSTSPAHASLTLEQKLERWSSALLTRVGS